MPRARAPRAGARAARALRVGALADARPAHALGRRAPARGARARARARGRDVLLLDEPLSALDARTRAARGARAGRACCARRGVPALLVTHDFAEAALLGDRGRRDRRAAGSSRRAAPRELAARAARRRSSPTSPARSCSRGTRAPRRRTASRASTLDGGGEVVAHRPRRRAGGGQRLPVGDRARARRQRARPARRRTASTVEVVSITDGRQPRAGRARGAAAARGRDHRRVAVRDLGLAPGARAVASWKAAATRVLPR